MDARAYAILVVLVLAVLVTVVGCFIRLGSYTRSNQALAQTELASLKATTLQHESNLEMTRQITAWRVEARHEGNAEAIERKIDFLRRTVHSVENSNDEAQSA